MSPTSGQRASAIAALFLLLAVLTLSVWIAVRGLPSNLIVLGCVGVAFAAAWYGVLRRGAARLLGLILALAALTGSVVILIVNGDHLAEAALIVAGLAAAIASAKAAFRLRVSLPSAPPPAQPVLLYNPKSGEARRSASRSPARRTIEGSPLWS